MNPKACTVIELYGMLDPITRDWTDGLLSNIFRDINKPTDKKERKYILFDGDVDALWVENMNSVMDDNKLLTLANGERIRLQKHCALLVEVIQCTHGICKCIVLHVYVLNFVNNFNCLYAYRCSLAILVLHIYMYMYFLSLFFPL